MHESSIQPVTSIQEPAPAALDASCARPFARSHAVLVGINHYRNYQNDQSYRGIPSLCTAVPDVELLETQLIKAGGYAVSVMSDGMATLAQLRSMLAKLERDVRADDQVLFYFAGHGSATETAQQTLRGFVYPYDACLEDEASLLSMAELRDRLVALPCRHLLLVADCCHAGAIQLATRDVEEPSERPLMRERFDRYVGNPVRQLLASASYNQRASDEIVGPSRPREASARHSPFAEAFASAISGAADLNYDGVITVSEVVAYIEQYFAKLEISQSAPPQHPCLINLRPRDLGEYVFFDPDHPPALPSALPFAAANNPYRGLQPYCERDVGLFFGRGERADQLFAALENNARVLVSGPPGSGKSSLIAAGLLPRVRRASRTLRIVGPFRPNARPLRSLRDACTAAGVSLTQPGTEPFLFVVDQIDELWTRCKDTSERSLFLATLEHITSDTSGCRLVMSIRSDFEGALRTAHPHLLESSHRFVISALKLTELRDAIERPAGGAALFFEPPELVDRIIDDVATVPGPLTLLSMVMSELYLKRVEVARSDRALTLEDYESIGGAAGSIGHALARIAPSEGTPAAATLRRVLLRMVDMGELAPVARRAYRSELKFAVPGEDDRVDDILEKLTDNRLIVIGHDHSGEEVMEPAHEALLTSWPTLEWIRAEQGQGGRLALQRRLGQAAYEHFQGDGGLWDRDPHLAAAHVLLDQDPVLLNVAEIAFLRKSRWCRVRRRAAAWIALASIIITLLGLLHHERSVRARLRAKALACPPAGVALIAPATQRVRMGKDARGASRVGRVEYWVWSPPRAGGAKRSPRRWRASRRRSAVPRARALDLR